MRMLRRQPRRRRVRPALPRRRRSRPQTGRRQRRAEEETDELGALACACEGMGKRMMLRPGRMELAAQRAQTRSRSKRSELVGVDVQQEKRDSVLLVAMRLVAIATSL